MIFKLKGSHDLVYQCISEEKWASGVVSVNLGKLGVELLFGRHLLFSDGG